MSEASVPNTLTIWPHYKVMQLRTMAELRELFPDGKANDLNWVFLSTSGVHGSYQSLDGVFSSDARIEAQEDGEEFEPMVTVLVVQPRLVVLRYGALHITVEDVPYLRGLVNSTLEAIPGTQIGNR